MATISVALGHHSDYTFLVTLSSLPMTPAARALARTAVTWAAIDPAALAAHLARVKGTITPKAVGLALAALETL